MENLSELILLSLVQPTMIEGTTDRNLHETILNLTEVREIKFVKSAKKKDTLQENVLKLLILK
jgi:hypothetical protein